MSCGSCCRSFCAVTANVSASLGRPGAAFSDRTLPQSAKKPVRTSFDENGYRSLRQDSSLAVAGVRACCRRLIRLPAHAAWTIVMVMTDTAPALFDRLADRYDQVIPF